MKKALLLLIPALLVTGCNHKQQKEEDYKLNLSIAAPSGAPSVCLYKYLADESKVEIRSPEEASGIAAYMATGAKDIIILPTNAGVQQIAKNNANYKIAACITFGNLFIAATGHDDDGVMNGDDYVVLIQQNNVPDKLFQYCYGDLNLTNTHYLTQASNVKNVVATGKNPEDSNADVDYVLVAEPAFAAGKSQNANATQYASIQEVYKTKSGNKEITQASVFVSNNANVEEVNKFLAALEKDINEFVADPSVIDKYVEGFDQVTFAAKFGVGNAQLLKTLTTNGNRMGVGYKNALENKANIDQFLSMWPVIGVTSEEIYYQ
ncbi:MAG: hypothetical protein J5511_00155 [Bacilli bacterium]|nr:hypothetical protein [Bacilli bacterium]